MKNLKKLLYVAFGTGVAILPATALAQSGSMAPDPVGNLSTSDFTTLLISIIQYFLGFVGLIAVAMLLYGGFQYLTSAGDDTAVGNAKKTILYAIVGIVIVILSWAIVNTIITSLEVL